VIAQTSYLVLREGRQYVAKRKAPPRWWPSSTSPRCSATIRGAASGCRTGVRVRRS